MTERDVFIGMLQRADAGERRAYLEDVCRADPGLRAQVEGLLEVYDRAGSFLETPARPPDASTELPAGTERPGAVVGPYKLLEQIGEGGFGVVFLAEQQHPVRRKVALKVLKPGMDTRQVVARFEAERQALAIMDHPNIARVFDGGATDQGRPFFAMEMVRGVPITDFCDQNQLTPRQRLELFVAVCQAVQHAHQKGVIHRDLKPSNVLVTVHDTVPVVKVIDFGVAKALGQELTDKTPFTGAAQMVGTPLYMSPEQAGMSHLDVDTRSDIYSLGVLLYELLTRTTPFDKERLRAAGYDEMRRIIREEEPPRPSTRLAQSTESLPSTSAHRHAEAAKLTKLVRGELDWIVMKCLEKDRNRRYETAGSLVADVRRFLNDEPVQACPPSAWYRLGKFTRRNRREVLIAGAAAVVAATGVGGLAVSRALISRALESEIAAKERERLEAYFQRITVAHHELTTGNLAAALRALDKCPEDLRGWEWHYLMRLFKYEPLVIPAKAGVHGVAFSSDGEQLASAGGDGTVRIWNSRTGEFIRDIPRAHDKMAFSVVFQPGDKHLATAGADGQVKVWDLTTKPAVRRFRGPCDALRKFGAAYTVAFRPPHGRYLAAGSERKVRVWDWNQNRPEAPDYTFPGPEYESIPVAFSPDGRRLATGLATDGDEEQGLRLWDVETDRPLGTLPERRHPVSALSFSPDGVRLASATLGRSLSLWNTTTGELLQSFPHTGNVLGAAFSRDGRRLVSTGEDKTVHVWDAEHLDEKHEPREVLGLHGHTDMCGCVAFSPDGWRLASASHDGTIRVWDATPLRAGEGQETLTFTQHHEVRSVAVSPDGARVVSGGNGTPVRVWDAATGRPTRELPGHRDVVFCVAWDPDGRRIAAAGTVGRRHTVKVRDASDGGDCFEIPPGRDSSAGPYQVAAFSPDRRYLVTGNLKGDVQVWDARNGEKVGLLGTHDREIRGLVFSPKGGHLVSASGDGTVKLWDATCLAEKPEPRTLPIRARVPGPSVNVAFSPDGRWLAAGGEENTVKIWDAEKDGDALTTLRGHTKEVYAVAFSPTDERPWVASGGEDGRVNIWDSRSGELVRSFRGHTGIISSVAFGPDGKRLYSGSRDATVKVWDLTKLSQVPKR